MNIDEDFKNESGETRKIGYELEFSGIKLKKAAEIIQSLYGGEISKKHRYRYDVTATEFGDFRAELDAQNMRKMANENAFKGWGIDFDKEEGNTTIETLVDQLTQSVVPLEIVMPPVAFNKIDGLEKLRTGLQQNKAKGTKESLVYAFGMHINIECPDLRGPTLLRYLRAFIILYPWLIQKLQIDVTRKVTPFVDPFPKEYAGLLLDPAYRPEKEAMMRDYVQHNPTRNRPLDMMPVWALDYAPEIQSTLKDEKNDPRPTFHYRMPNSHVDDANWQMKQELSHWMEVEALAARPDMIEKLAQLYLLENGRILVPFQKHWAETVTILLDLHE